MFLHHLLLLCLHSPLLHGYYCPEHHRHVGSGHGHLPGLRGGGGDGYIEHDHVPLPTPQFWSDQDNDRFSNNYYAIPGVYVVFYHQGQEYSQHLLSYWMCL